MSTLSLTTKKHLVDWQLRSTALSEKGFHAWIFCTGMRFNAINKWWGDLGERDFPHEGLDLCIYKDRGRRSRRVDETTQIPAVSDGRIRAIFKDYLGKAVIVEHDIQGEDHMGFLSIYAHTVPRAELGVGDIVNKDEIIATVACVKKSKANILPHLHLSFGWPTKAMFYDQFEWNRLRDPRLIRLVDPLEIMEWSYEVAE